MHKIAHARTWIVAALALTLSPMLTTGCAPTATYPPVEGSFGLNTPTYEPVPTIMADAIRYVHLHHGSDHPLAFNLPAGTSAKTYDRVIKRLGAGKPQTADDEWACYIQQVRSRGLNAEADVIFAQDNAPPAFLTLYLRKELSNYSVNHVKRWQLPAELPGPNWRPDLDMQQQQKAEDKNAIAQVE